MKIRRRCTLTIITLAAVSATAIAAQAPSAVNTNLPIGSITKVIPPAPIFYVQSYLGKCLDFGPSQTSGAQLYVSDCNHSAEQQVQVEEVNDRHEVILHAGSKVLGYRPPQMVATTGAPAAPVSPVYALELQNRASATSVVSAAAGAGAPSLANQIFALDGDSIILAADHTLVVQVQNSRGANGSPVIVAVRSLSDSEFWDFNQVDNYDIDPTRGFVRAGYPGSAATAYDTLLSKLAPWGGSLCQNASPACQPSPATLGTVIKIYGGSDINLTGLQPLQITAGVTIRGNRRGTLFGPLLHVDAPPPGTSMLEVQGNDVRITGLRLQGNSRSTDTDQPGAKGIRINPQLLRTIVDHNDISSWTVAGVEVIGTDPPQKIIACDLTSANDPANRPYDAFIARNFIHHNEMQNLGYGVSASLGAFPLVAANMYYLNRHSIASDGSAHSGYRAWFNLVLEDSPLQTTWGVPYHTQDFDMHGSDSNGFGGRGGDYVQIFRNTFLGTNRPNYELRGNPCNYSDFAMNVSLQDGGDAISYKVSEIPGTTTTGYPFNVGPGQFGFSNPADHLGVGDFDGDTHQDVFLATGTAWYYAPQGAAEWRFLSAKTDPIQNLIFGDFDGDGRTDVVGMNGNRLMVSWGGASDWEYLNSVNASITDLAVGKFGSHAPGDRRDDIFWADGKQWYVSSGGTGPFTAVNVSSFRVKDLRFGDFDGVGTTDVLGIVSGKWMVSYGAATVWFPMPKSLTTSLDAVVVADFDGDGRADIATSQFVLVGWTWQFSSAGASEWRFRKLGQGVIFPMPLFAAAAIGTFDGSKGADVLNWTDLHLYIVSGGSLEGAATWTEYSRQDLR